MTKTLLARVETRMIDALAPSERSANSVCRAGLHHLAAGGSRLRANLCLACSMQLGLDAEDAITLAAICELLHNASLIHDDLLDRAPLRRGLPSVWAAFNDAIAVCAGDFLLASAFALVGDLHSSNLLAPVLVLVHRRTRDVILGQGAEQACAPESLEGYELVAIGKSASLLSLPLELPLLLSGNDRFLGTAQSAARDFAAAYQMLDDLADYREDVRSGSLNAVSVALVLGSPDYSSACEFVCSRAEELIQRSIQDAAHLPFSCGAVMIAHAENMLSVLRAHRESAICPTQQLQHGG